MFCLSCVIDSVVGVFVRRSGGGERRWLFCSAMGIAGGVRGGLGIWWTI